MKNPSNYAEWSICLERLLDGNDDELVLSCLQGGTIEWGAGVAELLVKRIGEVLEKRVGVIQEKLNRDFGASQGDEGNILRATLTARRQLAFLIKVASCSAFPQNIQDSFISIITDSAKNMQCSLENSAKNDRTGKLASLFRNNSLSNLSYLLTQAEQYSSENVVTQKGRGRMILNG